MKPLSSSASIHIKDLHQLKHVHIIGVGGTLMGNFASFLKSQGIRVTGSDLKIYPPMCDVLKAADVEIFEGYSARDFFSTVDLIVVGNVIRKDNPEAQAALASERPCVSLPEFMEYFWLEKRKNIVIAGTHGKTTTTSLMIHVLKNAGVKPSYFVGGVAPQVPKSFHVDEGELFVLEGDEYDTVFWDKVPKFFHYCPNDVILTSIEFDHADIYNSLEDVKNAFRGLLRRIRSNSAQNDSHEGHLIAYAESENIQELLKENIFKGSVITYGLKDSTANLKADYQVELKDEPGRYVFYKGDSKLTEIQMQLFGRHNALNALSVYLEYKYNLQLDEDKILEGLRTFKGVKRRLEMVANVNDIQVLDDFAHHPTAVKETLFALKQKYPTSRLLIAFEPRSATSRRKIFQKEYAQVFEEGLRPEDRLWLAKPYDQSLISEENRFSTDELVNSLRNKNINVSIIQSIQQTAQDIAAFAEPGDVIAFLSNGSFDGLMPLVVEKLSGR